MKALILLMLLAVPVRAYTLVEDGSSPTGYSYGTGSSTVRIEGYQLGPGYRQDSIYVNGSPRGTCRTFSNGGYSQTSCQ